MKNMDKAFKLTLLIIVASILIGGTLGYALHWAVSRQGANIPSLLYANTRMTADSFVDAYYVKDQKGFKINSGSPVSFEATYYGIVSLHTVMRRTLTEKSSLNAEVASIFDKIRSYYNPAGYYADGTEDPVRATYWASSIDIRYPQDLGQKINLDWLKENSLANKNLDQSKSDPEYQNNVLMIYRNIKQDEAQKDLAKTAQAYLDYYCNYQVSDGVSDKDYLNARYYQTEIIYNLTNAGYASSTNCLAQSVGKSYVNRANKISLESLDSLKEVFQFQALNNYYKVQFNKNALADKLADFYTKGGFKEKLSDNEPNLKGMFYGPYAYFALFGLLF